MVYNRYITVKELIDRLEKINDKNLKVKLRNVNNHKENYMDEPKLYWIKDINLQYEDGWSDYIELEIE